MRKTSSHPKPFDLTVFTKRVVMPFLGGAIGAILSGQVEVPPALKSWLPVIGAGLMAAGVDLTSWKRS